MAIHCQQARQLLLKFSVPQPVDLGKKKWAASNQRLLIITSASFYYVGYCDGTWCTIRKDIL